VALQFRGEGLLAGPSLYRRARSRYAFLQGEKPMCSAGESYSDMILRLAKG
jgi:hypothetical protein